MRLMTAACLLILLVSTAPAADIQPVESIRQAAEAFVLAQYDEENLSVSAGRLDSRLRLARCDRPLSASAATPAAAGGNQSIGVSCAGPQRWTIYVPVKVTRSAEVVVLTRTVGRDTILAAEHMETMQRNVTGLNAGYFTQPEELIGHRVKRSVAAGTVLTPVLVHRPPMIARGDRVTLVSGGSAVAVSATGEALGEGRRGERVRVRNLSSGKVVEGVVKSRGRVEVLGL